MSYYDDYDDEYSSDEDIFYYNYSVDYANQILGGHHAVSSCLPLIRKKSHRRSPKLIHVSTLDQMPIVNRHSINPSLLSRAKYGNSNENLPSTRLPTLEETQEELERRATRTFPSAPQELSNNESSNNQQRSLTEDELRQVQQQQQAFQQHLMNMQRHLIEQQQQQGHLTRTSFDQNKQISMHNIQNDDDQAKIAELIENDPYFAAAMEDFVHSHGLLNSDRHSRTRSGDSVSSTNSTQRRQKQSHRNESFSSSSSSCSVSSSLTNVTKTSRYSNNDLVLLHELKEIRHLLKKCFQTKSQTDDVHQSTKKTVHFPPVEPLTDIPLSLVPSMKTQTPKTKEVTYQNIVEDMKNILGRRSPSQHDQPLKPSEIDPKLKYVFRKQLTTGSLNKKPPIPPISSQQTIKNSSQMKTAPSTNLIPTPPPYELLKEFSSSKTTSNQNRDLSYGNRRRETNVYDKLQSRNHFGLYQKKI